MAYSAYIAYLKDLFLRGPCQEVLINNFVRAIKTEYLTNSLLHLLLSSVKDPRLVQPAADYGVNWISEVIVQPSVQSEINRECLQLFTKDADVRNQAIDLTKWFVQKPEVADLTSRLMTDTMLREDTFDITMGQIGQGFTDAMCSYEARYLASEASFANLTDPDFVNKVKQIYA